MRPSWVLVLCLVSTLAACGGGESHATVSGVTDVRDAGERGVAGNGGTTGGASGTAGARGGAGGVNSSPGDAGGVTKDAADGPLCVPVTNTGSDIPAVFSSDAPPAPMGGTITSGLYHLTNLTYYGGTFSCTDIINRRTLEIVADTETSGTVRAIVTYGGSASTHPTFYTYEASGTSMTAMQFCNIKNTFHQAYTATATQLLYFRDLSADCTTSRLVETFTKQ